MIVKQELKVLGEFMEKGINKVRCGGFMSGIQKIIG